MHSLELDLARYIGTVFINVSIHDCMEQTVRATDSYLYS